jgi:hypothetical protein
MVRKPRSSRGLVRVEALENRLCLSSLGAGTTPTQTDDATQAEVSRNYGQLPLSFEANQGQADAQVNFLSRGSGYTLYLTPTQSVLDLQSSAGSDPAASGDELTMQLVGANPSAQATGLDLQPGVSNYLIGNDPAQWHTNVPNYARVAYENVYPGVNLVYYGNDQQHLEYDFVLAPGGNPNAIQLAFQGTQGISLDAQGDLVLKTSGGDVTEQAPIVYQDVNGARQAISGRYVLEGGNQVGFQVGSYDPTRPLVIDPTYSLGYSTYLGGSGGSRGNGIAVDSSGDAYVTGTAWGGFPLKNPLQGKYAGNADVFVTKLNAAGTALVYSTYLGGSSGDSGSAIAVDASGNAYVSGVTGSTNFPTKNAYQSQLSGGQGQDAFLAKLNASGSALLYSSYLGGSGTEGCYSIALDGSGDAFVTGQTNSTNFPTTPGAYQTTYTSAPIDVFVSKLNPNQSGSASLVYSTYMGTGRGYGIAVDGSGNAYVSGYNTSRSVIVTELNAAGSALVYSTSLGGSWGQAATAIALDAAGDAYVTGWTYSSDFPTTPGAFETVYPGHNSPFVTKLDGTGSIVYSTFLDGTNSTVGINDAGYGIAVDAAGDAYVTGFTASTNFPIANAFQPTYGGGQDAFVSELNAAGSALVYSSYLGGSDPDAGYGIALDSSGNTYVTGYTYTSFPTTPGAFQTTYPGPIKHPVAEAFVTKIDPPTSAPLASASNHTAASSGSGTLSSSRPSLPQGPLARVAPRESNLLGAGVLGNASSDQHAGGLDRMPRRHQGRTISTLAFAPKLARPAWAASAARNPANLTVRTTLT